MIENVEFDEVDLTLPIKKENEWIEAKNKILLSNVKRKLLKAK